MSHSIDKDYYHAYGETMINKNVYELKLTEFIVCEKWRVDMENYTGFDVQMVYYKSGKIGVSIDRKGHFIFASKNALVGKKNTGYLMEKLFLSESDAQGMINFFEHLFSE